MSFQFEKGDLVKKGNVEEGVYDYIERSANAMEKYFLEPLATFSGIKTGADFLGKQSMRIGENLAYQIDPNVREMSMGEEGKNILPGSADLLDSSSGRTAEKIGGESAQTFFELAPWFIGGIPAGGTLLSRSTQFGLRGSAIATGWDVANQMQKGEYNIKKTIGGAVTSFFTSALFNVAVEKASNFFQKRATDKYGRAFKPSKREVAADIQRNYETINTKMSKEGYVGTAEMIRKQSEKNLSKYGTEIGEKLKSADEAGEKILRGEVMKGIEEKLSQNDVLTDSEISLIVKEVNKIPNQMSLEKANELKIYFAEKVTPSSWSAPLGRADTFRNDLYKTLSGDLRMAIEKKVPGIDKVNEKWAIALDTNKLSSDLSAAEQLVSGFGEKLAKGKWGEAFMSLPILRDITSTASRTIRAQIDQQLSNLTKEDLVKRLARYIWLEFQSK